MHMFFFSVHMFSVHMVCIYAWVWWCEWPFIIIIIMVAPPPPHTPCPTPSRTQDCNECRPPRPTKNQPPIDRPCTHRSRFEDDRQQDLPVQVRPALALQVLHVRHALRSSDQHGVQLQRHAANVVISHNLHRHHLVWTDTHTCHDTWGPSPQSPGGRASTRGDGVEGGKERGGVFVATAVCC